MTPVKKTKTSKKTRTRAEILLERLAKAETLLAEGDKDLLLWPEQWGQWAEGAEQWAEEAEQWKEEREWDQDDED